MFTYEYKLTDDEVRQVVKNFISKDYYEHTEETVAMILNLWITHYTTFNKVGGYLRYISKFSKYLARQHIEKEQPKYNEYRKKLGLEPIDD